MANVSELEKKKLELAKELQKIDDQLKTEKTKEATNVFNEIIKLLDGFSGYLSEDQKGSIGAYVLPPPAPGAKGKTKARKSGGPKVIKPSNWKLAGGEKTEFFYGGKGPKPELLRNFEASPEGQKLVAEGKPVYVAL